MTGHTPATRLSLFDTPRTWQLAVLSALLTVGMTAALILREMADVAGTGGVTASIDFYVFWAAAKLALQGTPLDAFSVSRIEEIAAISGGGWMPWAYPPGFMTLVTPFGTLPFALAWGLFVLTSMLALLLATRPFTEGRPQVTLAIALAPAMLPCLLVGQTSVLWLAGLMAALASLAAGRPILAGVFIGLLTLKPQLGLLIPIALLAAGQWRTILAATVTTLILAALPTALYGIAYWSEMLTMMAQHGEAVRNSVAELPLMISAYSALTGLGLAEPTALAAQWALSATCALAVFLVWRKPNTSFDLKAATLLSAIPLASPYLWHYESAFLAPAALFLLRAGIIGEDRALTLVLGLLMWLGLGPSAILLLTTGWAETFRLVFLPVALTAFLTCLWHALLRPRNAPAQGLRDTISEG